MIGIIGGAGVAATNKLCELIEEKMTANGAFRDAHHPEMLIWQATKVPSRSMYYEGKGESFIPDYIDIGKKMKQCGVTKIVMCCNTAHMAIDEITEAVGLPFINIMQEVGKVVREKNVHKVGVICSDSLAKSKFYNQYITDPNKGLEVVYPDSDFQAIVTSGICNAKNRKRFLDKKNVEHPYTLFSRVVSHLKQKGVDCILAGCTDIRNVFTPSESLLGGVEYVDCLEVMADTIIKNKDEKYEQR